MLVTWGKQTRGREMGYAARQVTRGGGLSVAQVDRTLREGCCYSYMVCMIFM